MVPKLSVAWWQQESHKHILSQSPFHAPHRAEDSIKSFCAMPLGDSPSQLSWTLYYQILSSPVTAQHLLNLPSRQHGWSIYTLHREKGGRGPRLGCGSGCQGGPGRSGCCSFDNSPTGPPSLFALTKEAEA